jgi:hypothetical protein
MPTLTPPDTAAIPICAAIRDLPELTPSVVQQILNTLACRMKADDYCDSDVQLLDDAADVIGPL